MEDDRPKCIGCPRIFDWDEDWRMDDNGEIGCVACFTDGADCPFSAQGIEAGTVETERLDAQHESPVACDALIPHLGEQS